jgi:soluble lytic murein transglycosylase
MIIAVSMPNGENYASILRSSMKIFFVFLILVPALACAGDLERQRQQFLPLYRAAVAGTTPASARVAALRSYPLVQYLRYYQLHPRLRALPAREVRAFLTEYPGSLLTDRLRTEWLRETARAGRWDLFMDDYTPQHDPELQCHALASQIRHGEFETANAALESLWLVGKSQSEACDPVFAALRSRGVLTDTLVFERVLLAARAGNASLGYQIAKRYAPQSDQAFAKLLLQVHGNPATTLRVQSSNRDSARMRAVVVHGLGRLARQNVARAHSAWATARKRYAFTSDETALLQRYLAVAAVAQAHSTLLARLDDVGTSAVDAEIEHLRLREGLKAQAWDKIAKWTAGEPQGLTTNPLRWRYWHARALEELGRDAEAVAAFKNLALERDYYGFMASDKIGQDYMMNHKSIAPTSEERARVSRLGGIQHAYEFYRLGLRFEAREELNFVIANNPKRDLEVVAALVAEWGWIDRAIAIVGQIKSYDDLDIRFPLLHDGLVRKFAKQRGLKPALVYSIIRGESAFLADARSSAGALGLMQLMPTTGDITAKHIGVSLATPTELTKVDKNIAIGSEYLRQVLRQFNGSFPLAAAAYNAGPSRVRGWLKTSHCVPADIWVDTIPFAETEAYVRRALFYAAIYEHRLGEVIEPLSIRLANLTTHSAGEGQC